MESLEKIFESNWGSVFMIYDSKKINLLEIEHIKILSNNTLEGIITFFEDPVAIHIVSLNSFVSGKIEAIAKQREKQTLYVETTNDNCNAIKFYQTYGFDMYQLQIDEVSN